MLVFAETLPDLTQPLDILDLRHLAAKPKNAQTTILRHRQSHLKVQPKAAKRIESHLLQTPWPRKVLVYCSNTLEKQATDFLPNSKVTHHRGAHHLHGLDRLLQDSYPTSST